MKPGDRLEVNQERIQRLDSSEQQTKRNELKDKAAKEVSREMTKEQVQAAAAEEMKLAEYQLGKAMIDVFGMRTRVEEYIFKPQPNQIKFVVLNTRERGAYKIFCERVLFSSSCPPLIAVEGRLRRASRP